MKIKTLITVFLITAIMTSCATATESVPTKIATSTQPSTKKTQLSPTEYLEQILTLDKCNNLCWLGIEPGTVSSAESIKEVLSQFYGRENVYISPKTSQSVHWRTTTTFPQRGVVLLNQNKRVVSIQVFFTENQITIDNLISKIGEPEYVLLAGYDQPQGFQCDGIWGMLYIQSGLEVVTEQTTGSIKQTQFIYYVGIDEPSTFNDKHWWSNSTLYKTVKWEGYNNYCASE